MYNMYTGTNSVVYALSSPNAADVQNVHVCDDYKRMRPRQFMNEMLACDGESTGTTNHQRESAVHDLRCMCTTKEKCDPPPLVYLGVMALIIVILEDHSGR